MIRATSSSTSRLASALPWLLLLMLPALAQAAPDEFKAHKATYEQYLQRPSLSLRHRGRERFAQTGDVRALEILARSYARPEKPKAMVRYLLASICADAFRQPEALPVFRAWREKHRNALDAWLWFRTLAVDHQLEGPDYLVAVARQGKSPWLRAAAFEALSAAKDPVLPALLTEMLRTPPANSIDRTLLLRAAASTLYRNRRHRKTEAWQTLARTLLPLLDEKNVDDATRLVVARRLAPIFGTKILYRTRAPWLALLEGKQPAEDAAPPDASRARFLGLQATGKRIGYVLDLSDSMLTPLTTEEVKDLAKVEDLPWSDVISRFDAVREVMKVSLRTLSPEQSFCVVTFGSEAKLLDATRGLRKATDANIRKAIRELEDIEIGPPKKGRPHGTLRGYTNLHGGLHRAFEVQGAKRLKQGEYVDAAALEGGCDTIFLFSDGKPTWDDYPTDDIIEAVDDPGDPETGWKSKNARTGMRYGPYALTKWLRDDLTRLNLFRRVEIHCVGLGEYDPHLLSWLSRTNLGTLRLIGRPDDTGKKRPRKKGE